MGNTRESNNFYISTVAMDAVETAKKYGFGLEIAEFCTALNMDMGFDYWDGTVKEKMAGADKFTFHAPFNELCPSAIDPLILEVAHKRYNQAYELMRSYGINKMVVHSGYLPHVYFKDYFVERSVRFWREFLQDKHEDFSLCIENVLEDAPDILIRIVKEVDDRRMGICLDIGHANTVVSNKPILEWIDEVSPFLSHIHIHNNYREYDNHNPVSDGLIDYSAAMKSLFEKRPDVSVTIESLDAEKTASWLCENGFCER